MNDGGEVAEVVGKNHADVIREIRTIIDHLGGKATIGQSYFIESTYINAQNKQQPCYQLTKKGCDMVANKMTGVKGTYSEKEGSRIVGTNACRNVERFPKWKR